MKISKIILIIILFIAFFEIGLFSSYTIVTGEIPDVGEIIGMQTEFIGSIFSSDNVGGILIKDPTEINITNKLDVAEKLKNKANVDGIDVDNLTIGTTSDLDEENITVNITAFGFSAPSTSSGQIVIKSEPDYKVSAIASATYTYAGFKVDVSSIKIVSILKMYNSTTTTSKSTSYKSSKSSSKGYDSGWSSDSSNSQSYNSGSSSSGSSNSGSSSGSGSNFGSGSSGSGSEDET